MNPVNAGIVLEPQYYYNSSVCPESLPAVLGAYWLVIIMLWVIQCAGGSGRPRALPNKNHGSGRPVATGER